MIVKIIKELGRRMDVQNKKLEFLIRVRNCNKQSEMKNTINEMKNILEESVVD